MNLHRAAKASVLDERGGRSGRLILEREIIRHGGGLLAVNHASLVSVDQDSGKSLEPGRRASRIVWFIEKGLCHSRTTWGNPGVERYREYLQEKTVWRGTEGEESLSTAALTTIPVDLLPGVPTSDDDLPSGGEWDDIKDSAYWNLEFGEDAVFQGRGLRAAALFPCGPGAVPVCGANFGMGGAVVRIRHPEQYNENRNWHLVRGYGAAKEAGRAAEPQEYFEAIRAAKKEALREASQIDCMKASRTEKDEKTGEEKQVPCHIPDPKAGFPFVRAFVLQHVRIEHDHKVTVFASYALALAQSQKDCNPIGTPGRGTTTPPGGGGGTPTTPGGGSGSQQAPGGRGRGVATLPSNAPKAPTKPDNGLPPVTDGGGFFPDEGDERIRGAL